MYILKTTNELIFLLHVHLKTTSDYMYILKTTSELIFLLHVHIENNKWINFPTTCTYWKQQMN